MKKIVLDIEEDNIETVLLILKNLKDDLINNILLDDKNITIKRTQYMPKQNKIIMEDEPTVNKYMNATTYKKRLASK